MKFLELRIPPPVIGLLSAAATWYLSTVTPTLDIPSATRIGGGGVIALVGAAFDLVALIYFVRAKTTVNPLKPAKSTALVTSGAYRITRNPMYVGMLLMLIAWALFLAAPLAIAGPLLFFAWIGRFQIAPEERVLEAMFGEDYRAYRRQVRRWL